MQWLIGGWGGGCKGRAALSHSISFIFMQFSAKIMPNHRLAFPWVGIPGKSWIRHSRWSLRQLSNLIIFKLCIDLQNYRNQWRI